MTHPGTITDAEAAEAWAKYRGLDLGQIRTWTLGQAADYLATAGVTKAVGPDPIPQYVIRTLADLERAAQPEQDTPGD